MEEQQPKRRILSSYTKILIVFVVIVLIAFAVAEKIAVTMNQDRQATSQSVSPVQITNTDKNASSTGAIDQNILLAQASTSQTTGTTATPKAPPGPPKPAPVTAEEFYVANLTTGEVYSNYNSTVVHPIASLSKLITALVALHTRDMSQEVTIDQSMLDAYGTQGELVLGDKLTVSELFNPMLLESSNDAAEAIAQSDPGGYGAFIAKMNSFAAELGMHSTSFKDASGLSDGNISDAQDLFILAQYIYNNEPALLQLTRTTQVTLASTTDHGGYTWNTINPFAFDPHFIGGKTGRTDEAKESMISMFKYDYASTTNLIAVIVLRSDFSERQNDSAILYEEAIAKITKGAVATN